MKKSIILAVLLIIITITNIAHAGHEHGKSLGAHEHGSLKLGLAVDGKTIDIDLDGPAESFLGFEYAPKSESEKKLFAAHEELWKKNLLTLFTFEKSLGCVVTEPSFKQEIELPHDEKGNKHEKEAGAHSDIEATAKITCNKDLKGQTLKISLRKHFPKIKKLKVDLLGSETKSIELTKPIEDVKL